MLKQTKNSVVGTAHNFYSANASQTNVKQSLLTSTKSTKSPGRISIMSNGSRHSVDESKRRTDSHTTAQSPAKMLQVHSIPSQYQKSQAEGGGKKSQSVPAKTVVNDPKELILN